MNNQLQQVTHFLKTKHILISSQNEWLLECCEYFFQSNQQGTMSELFEFVYDQILMADLRDIGEKSLPDNLKNVTVTSLNSKYILQVNDILDVAESAYSQLRKFQNKTMTVVEDENAEEKKSSWQPKKTRMYKMTVTDGVQCIHAMEFEPISILNPEVLIPGFKVLITGPVECRRGILLLRNENIQVLGGECDSLINSNSMSNVLKRRLNINDNDSDATSAIVPVCSPNTNTNRNVVDLPRIPQSTTTNENTRNANDNVIDELQDLRSIPLDEFDEDIEIPDSFDNVITNPSTSRRRNSTPVRTESPLNSFIDDENSFTDSPNYISHISPPPINFTSSSGYVSNSVDTNNSTPYPSFGRRGTLEGVVYPRSTTPPIKRLAESSNMVEQIPVKKITSRSDPNSKTLAEAINLITELESQEENTASKRIVIYGAKISKLIGKPKIKNDQWRVVVEIIDADTKLNTSVSDSLLENSIFGISAYEVQSQKEQMMTNPDLKLRVENILKTGVEKLLTSSGDLHLIVTPGKELPILKRIISM